MFKFDLKSGYHHIDIAPSHQTYLGFAWEEKFYCFTVLPFGLTSAPYIFTKCLRPLVKYWRANFVDIVVYLDDGWGCSPDFSSCVKTSNFVLKTLMKAGFLVNKAKSIWDPVKKLEWLGLVWSSFYFTISIPERRLKDLSVSIHIAMSKLPGLSAREVAQITGRVISLSPVVGNVFL